MRRSRDRFWRPAGGAGAADGAQAPAPGSAAPAGPEDKQDAYDTLHTVLEVLSRIVAPFLPFLGEAVYQGLTGARSVHLASWPLADELPSDPALVEAMDLAREVSSAGHSIRKAAGLRARLPLSRLTVAAAGASLLAPFADLIADEVNVHEVELVESVGELGETVLSIVPAALGPRLGERTQHVIAAARKGDWSQLADGTVEVGGVPLLAGEYDLRLRPRDPTRSRALPGEVGIVSVDLETTPELLAEGLARDVIRLVQRARRDAGLHVTDRIRLVVALPEEPAAAIQPWLDHIAAQVLGLELMIEALIDQDSKPADRDGWFMAAGELPDGGSVVVQVQRV